MKKDKKKSKKNINWLFYLVGLLIPPIGIVLYIINKKRNSKLAKNILTSLIIGVCFYAFSLLIYINRIPEKNVSDWYRDVNSSKEVVTVFGLTSCPHCQELKPVINKLSKKYEFNLYFFEVDTLSEEDNNILFNTLELKDYDEHVPFTFIVRNKEYVTGKVGYANQEALEEYLEENGVIKKD